MSNSPTVTIAIPAYNEAVDIERVILGFLSTQYEKLLEIFVADGGSTDKTREIVRNISVIDPRVKLIDNPYQIQSYGLNLMIEAASGDIFLRADAHSDYASDYVERCVETLLESYALNVGGAQRFVSKAPFQAAVALATKSVLGSGGAKYRDTNYDGFADTVYLGCFWRDVLVHLGGFNTKAVTNQDAEFNLRLRNLLSHDSHPCFENNKFVQDLGSKSNQAVYISSTIKAWYYPRKTWRSLFKQYFKYGRGRYLTSTKHSDDFQLRGKLPFIVISSFVFSAFLSLFLPLLRLPIIVLLAAIILLLLFESFRVNWKFRKRFKTDIWKGDQSQIPSFPFRWFSCAIVFATMPIAHFSGYTYQLLKHKILNKPGW